jgi:hypothetical protein
MGRKKILLAALAKHAATALHLTSLHERDRRAPVEAPGFAS